MNAKSLKILPWSEIKGRRLLVAGDIHGDMETLNLLLKKFEPDHDHLIFLGDYADRGQKSVEVIETIKALLQEYPGRVHALKGNHEDYTSDGKPLFQPCTLVTDVIQKRGDWTTYFHQTLTPFFQRLHLALIIPRVFLFVHGGVSGKIQGINSLTDPS
ncbi:MAG: metallophosphoesterase family protein, partial [Candidatus Ranarchaeia archaeon]